MLCVEGGGGRKILDGLDLVRLGALLGSSIWALMRGCSGDLVSQWGSLPADRWSGVE